MAKFTYKDYKSAIDEYGEKAVHQALLGDQKEFDNSMEADLSFDDLAHRNLAAKDMDRDEVRKGLNGDHSRLYWSQFSSDFMATTQDQFSERVSIYSNPDNDLSHAEVNATIGANEAAANDFEEESEGQEQAELKATQRQRAIEAGTNARTRLMSNSHLSRHRLAQARG